MTVNYTFSRNALSVFIEGRPHPVDNTNPNYQTILDGLRSRSLSEDQVLALVNHRAAVQAAVARLSFGDITVGNDGVFYGEQMIHGYLTTRMLEILAQGHDITPWGHFLNRIYQNPRPGAVEALGRWLVGVGMPITMEGKLLAYKKVREDYTPFAGVRLIYEPDTIVSSDERGLGFCSWHYLPRTRGDNGRVMIVEVDPADILTIPGDYDNGIGSATRFKVLAEIAPSLVGFAYPNYTPAYDDALAA